MNPKRDEEIAQLYARLAVLGPETHEYREAHARLRELQRQEAAEMAAHFEALKDLDEAMARANALIEGRKE